MTDWQPIETAPQFQPILVWDGDSIHIALHRDAAASAHPWFEECACDDPMPLEPTHWMPLPEPPAPQSWVEARREVLEGWGK